MTWVVAANDFRAQPDVYRRFQFWALRYPTSGELLEPSSPLLEAMATMPFSPRVRLHSIIGTGGSMLAEAGDGVVPVASARLAGVCSELRVPVRHDELQHGSATTAELIRILREHPG